MSDIQRIQRGNGAKKVKNFLYYMKKINFDTLLYLLHQSNGYVSEWAMVLEGLADCYKYHRALKGIVERFVPDVILYRYQPFNFGPYRISASYNIPILGEVNFLRSMEAPMWSGRHESTVVTRFFERRGIRSFDHMFCVSRGMKDGIDQYADPSRSCVIPNGVDTEKFSVAKYDKVLAKAKLNLSGKTVIGYVGSYKSWHGLDVSLDVMERLSMRDESFHLLLIGNGDEYSRIEKLVCEKKLHGCVTQIDYVPHQQIPEYMAAFDCALMTYPEIKPFHFSPLKMFEYMAMGVPVITTDIGQIGEIITHGHTGILVLPPAADCFVEAILDGRDNFPEMGLNARKLMEDEYSWLANGEKVLAICERLRRHGNGAANSRKSSGTSEGTQ